MVGVEAVGFQGDGARSDLLRLVIRSQWSILIWTVGSFGVPLRAKAELFQQ